MNHHHFLLITLPYKSHINPTLQLAKKLSRAAAHVTLVTTVTGLNRLKTRPFIHNLSYAAISDGHDTTTTSTTEYFQEFQRVGPTNLKNLLLTKSQEGQKVDFLIYGLCLPWVAEVAREVNAPSAFFFVQSAAAFSLYYHCCGTHDSNSRITPTGTLNLPGLPLLKHTEIPKFLSPEDPFYSAIAPLLQAHIQTLEKSPNPCVIINTFDDLERNWMEPISNRVNIFPIGPLICGEIESSFSCDLYPISDREMYLRWLDSKQEKSVVYVAFGSLVELGRKQKEEIYGGLVRSGRPFLWVLRNQVDEEMEGLKDTDGLILKWCLQMEVLNHVSIGCFVTHCGWNSTIESLVGGVGMVGCPQFGDQQMNMRMVEDVWGNGLRATMRDDDVVGREEIGRCLEVVMGGGEKGEEIRKNVEKWKGLAMEALEEGIFFDEHLVKFIEKLMCICGENTGYNNDIMLL